MYVAISKILIKCNFLTINYVVLTKVKVSNHVVLFFLLIECNLIFWKCFIVVRNMVIGQWFRRQSEISHKHRKKCLLAIKIAKYKNRLVIFVIISRYQCQWKFMIVFLLAVEVIDNAMPCARYWKYRAKWSRVTMQI